ncbi:ADP-ribosyltransferase [Bacillus cereus group sp. BfR-BA-01524]|uniref:ADP-ribosyltransferase n=1 Tax=Bacillus cereus group sp. BfR-BA-01524 TaxID=2920372 RepID=UPI001F5A2873
MNIIKDKIYRSVLIAVTLVCMLSFVNPVQIWAADSDEIVSNHIDGLIEFEGNYKDADIWGENKYKEWRESLTDKEKETIKKYTKNGYEMINFYLREMKGKLINEFLYESLNLQINILDKVLKKTETETPITVYRSVSHKMLGIDDIVSRIYEKNEGKMDDHEAAYFSEVKKKLKGKVITNYGYMSSSLSKRLDGKILNGEYDVLIKIKLPAGTNAAYIGNLSIYPAETEMLVARGFEYQIEDLSWIVLNGEKILEISAKGIKK